MSKESKSPKPSELVSPQNRKVILPKYLMHYGTCDCCNKRLIRVLHLRYDLRGKGWRICCDCMTEAFNDTQLEMFLDVMRCRL